MDSRARATCASVACALPFAASIWRRMAPHRSSSQLADALALKLLDTPLVTLEPVAEPPVMELPVDGENPEPTPVRLPDNPVVMSGKRFAVLACTIASASRYAASAAAIDWFAFCDC